MVTSTDPSGRCSPTGYEAFLEDSLQSAAKIAKIQEPSSKKDPPNPSSENAPPTKMTAAEAGSWSITTEAQGLITNYFSPESPCGDKPVPTGCTDLPDLVASSSSEKSGDKKCEKKRESYMTIKGELSSLVDKMRSTCYVDPGSTACYMDTACGKVEFEKEQEQTKPALTGQGELLRIEGPPPPKSWTEEISSKVQEAQRAISSKTRDLFSALGLLTKKEQALMTDFYATKPVEKPKPKKQVTKKEPASSASFSAQTLLTSGMTAIGLGPKAQTKDKKQTLITDFDCNKVPPTVLNAENSDMAEAETKPEKVIDTIIRTEKTEIPDVPDDPSIPSIATEIENAPEEKETKWNLGKQVKNIMSKLKLPEKSTPTCEVPTVPKVEVPPLTSFGVFLCNPKAGNEESTTKAVKADGGQVMVEVGKGEAAVKAKVEEIKTGENKVGEDKVVEDKTGDEETKAGPSKVEETEKTAEVVAEERERVEERHSGLPW